MESDGSSAALGNVADLFREEVESGHTPSVILDEPGQVEGQDDQDSKIFGKDRVDPILLTAAQLAGAEYLQSEEAQTSLVFGHSGLKKKKVSPILCMPPDIYGMRDDARAFKGALGKTNALTGVFRVPDDDFAELFHVPPLGKYVDSFVRKSPGNQPFFIKNWEAGLKGIDHELRTLSRLATFQLLIANAMSIQLSDSAGAEDKDSPFAMARLTTDLAARQAAVLMRLSTQTVRLRRENVFASVPGLHKQRLIEKLKELPISNDSLFGDGGFLKVVKRIAGDVAREKTLGSQLHSFAASSNKPGNAPRRQQRNRRGGRRAHPYAGDKFGRSSGRGFQPKTKTSSFTARGGSSSRPARGQRGGRGRGRGRPWKRL
jgi:hypothetical protein